MNPLTFTVSISIMPDEVHQPPGHISLNEKYDRLNPGWLDVIVSLKMVPDRLWVQVRAHTICSARGI